MNRLLLSFFILLIASQGFGESDADVLENTSVLPPEIPDLLTPHKEEIPSTFSLVEDGEILEVMGMDENPGYITNRSETSALAERGALCSFAVIYQDEKGIALIINGIYFRDKEDFERFWKDQEEKDLRIVGFQGPEPDGFWLVLLGCDPKREYTEEEVETIKGGMKLYEKRLELTQLFNTFTLKPKQINSPEE